MRRRTIRSVLGLALLGTSAVSAQEPAPLLPAEPGRELLYFPLGVAGVGRGLQSGTVALKQARCASGEVVSSGRQPSIRYQARIIETRTHLRQLLTGSSSNSIPIIGGGINGAFSEDQTVSHNSLFVLLDAEATWPVEELLDFNITEEHTALLRRNPGQFFDVCGDAATVIGLRHAKLGVLVEIMASSTAEIQTIKADLGVDFGGIFSSKNEIQRRIERNILRRSYRARVLDDLGLNVPSDTTDIGQFIAWIDQFIERVNTIDPSEVPVRIVGSASYREAVGLDPELRPLIRILETSRFRRLVELYDGALDLRRYVTEALSAPLEFDEFDEREYRDLADELPALQDSLRRAYDACEAGLPANCDSIVIPAIPHVTRVPRYGPIGLTWEGSRRSGNGQFRRQMLWRRIARSNMFRVFERQGQGWSERGEARVEISGDEVNVSQLRLSGVVCTFRGSLDRALQTARGRYRCNNGNFPNDRNWSVHISSVRGQELRNR